MFAVSRKEARPVITTANASPFFGKTILFAPSQ